MNRKNEKEPSPLPGSRCRHLFAFLPSRGWSLVLRHHRSRESSIAGSAQITLSPQAALHAAGGHIHGERDVEQRRGRRRECGGRTAEF